MTLLLQSFSAPVSMVVFGDSITAGNIASNLSTLGYVPLTAGVEQTFYGGNTGEGFIGNWRADRWTVVGGWTNAPYGPFGSAQKGHGGGINMSITMTGDSFDIYYVDDSASGQFTVQIDAETPVNVGSSNATPIYRKTTVSSVGGAGSHTVTIIPPASALVVNFIGASANIGGSGGCRIHNVGKSGATASSASNGGDYGWLASFAPKLTVLAFGVNDWGAQVPLATFKTQMMAMIAAVKAVGSECLILIEPPDSRSFTIPQFAYVSLLTCIAATETNQIALDFFSKWGGTHAAAVALAFMTGGDNTHPNDAGHSNMATNLEAVVAGTGGYYKGAT